MSCRLPALVPRVLNLGLASVHDDAYLYRVSPSHRVMPKIGETLTMIIRNIPAVTGTTEVRISIDGYLIPLYHSATNTPVIYSEINTGIPYQVTASSDRFYIV